MLNEVISSSGVNVWMILKWVYVILFGLYFGFSLIVGRQMQLMHKTLAGTGVVSMKMTGIGLVIVAGVAMLLALVLL